MRKQQLVWLGLMALAACGGAEFQRAPGATVYAALQPGTPVALVESDAALPQPVVEVGSLRLQDSSGDEAKVKQALQIAARRKGCDAIVGLASTLDEQRKVVEERGLDSSGKPAVIQKEQVKRRWVWQGRCVRSAAAGLPASATPAAPTSSPATTEALPAEPAPAADPAPAPEGAAAAEETPK